MKTMQETVQDLQKTLNRISQESIKREKERFTKELESHDGSGKIILDKFVSFRQQIIALESAFIGTTIIFASKEQITLWIASAIALFIVSIAIGLLLLKNGIDVEWYLHWEKYAEIFKFHWKMRKVSSDKTVEEEQKLLEPEIEKLRQPFANPIFKFISADNLDKIFYLCFYLGLSLLVLQMFNGLLV